MSALILHLNDDSSLAVTKELKEDKKFSSLNFQELSISKLKGLKKREFASGLDSLPMYAALIWGDGENHHTSLAMSPRAKFIKSVDDAHEDYVPINLLCNSFLYASHNTVLALHNEFISEIEVIGLRNHPYTAEVKGASGTVSFYAHSGPSRLCTTNEPMLVHKSIDFDVMQGFPAWRIWQQGEKFSKEFIENAFEGLCKAHYVKRFDLGGLSLPNEDESKKYTELGLLNPIKDRKVFNYAVDCYKSMLSIWLGYINSKS